MKSTDFFGVRHKQFFLTLTVIVCTTLLVWAWERTPLAAIYLQSQQQFDAISSGKDLSETLATNHSGYQPKQHNNVNISNETVASPSHIEVPAVAPVGSADKLATEYKKEDESEKMVAESKKGECNYAKGKWVPDNSRPLYSGAQCKQWLSVMWACRLMQRTDFSYEGFRWQPDNCEMPHFDYYSLKRLKDKTIAFVGDSLGRQQFQSLMCMVTGGEISIQVQDIGKEYGLAKAPHAKRPDGWVYRFPSTNTTILYYWSASLCRLEPLDPSSKYTSYAMHLDRPAKFLTKYLHRFDVLVLNTGHHWNRGKLTANRWEMYAGGKPVKDRKLAMINNAKNFAVYNVVKWLDSQLPRYPKLKAFFRTLSPRHFVNGDWNTGGSCDNTTPLAGGDRVSQNGSIDTATEAAVRGTKVKVLDITALSKLREEGHISRYSIRSFTGIHDCLHWCLPGIPDTWNEILLAQILLENK